MNQEEFIEKYQLELPMLRVWGEFAKNVIETGLKKKVEGEHGYSEVVKITPSVRTKDVDSLVNKAFVRKADKYKDPYDDLTDKVGIRFVVLLSSQLQILKEIIESCSHWRFSLDRDFEDEKAREPRLFDYQSVHYIIRALCDFEHDGQKILKGTPCEVQLRTLLQHAYAELTHDTIYKSKVRTEPEVHRTIAKSMALMETTDDLFVRARNLLEDKSLILGQWENRLKERFLEVAAGYFASNHDEKNSTFILDASIELLRKHSPDDLDGFLTDPKYAYLWDRIREKAKRDIFFRQPIILLVYFLSHLYRSTLPDKWPLERKLLEPIYSDLGLAPTW